MDLLSRREHSLTELYSKLRQRGYEVDDIEPVLTRLQQQDLQSDWRFAEMYLRSCANRGLGPTRIRHELDQRGVAQNLIEKAFQQANYCWQQLCQQAHQKRFGDHLPADHREKAKQARFLQYRGFTFEQINKILNG